MKNQDIVYKICKEHCPARTEQLEIIGLQAGILEQVRKGLAKAIVKEKPMRVK